MRYPRILVILTAAVLLGACSSLSGDAPSGRILVLDTSGAPIVGARLLPDDDAVHTAPVKYDDSIPSSDAHGLFVLDLDDYYSWKDSCYHFRVHKKGYVDETLAVSKDLMPAQLKVELKSTASAAGPVPPAFSAPNSGNR